MSNLYFKENYSILPRDFYFSEQDTIPKQTSERPSKIQRIVKNFFDTSPNVTSQSSQNVNPYFYDSIGFDSFDSNPDTNTNTYSEGFPIDLSKIPIIPPDDCFIYPIEEHFHATSKSSYPYINAGMHWQQFSSYSPSPSLNSSGLIQTPSITSDFPKQPSLESHDPSSSNNSYTKANFKTPDPRKNIESKKHLQVISPSANCVISIKQLYAEQNLSEKLNKALNNANMDVATLAKKIEVYYPNSFNCRSLTATIRFILEKKRWTLDLRIVDAINNILGCLIFNLSEQYIEIYKIEEGVPIKSEERSILHHNLQRCELFLCDLATLINSQKFLDRKIIGNKKQLKQFKTTNLSHVMNKKSTNMWPCAVDRIHAIFGKTILSKRPYAKFNTKFSNMLITPGAEAQKRLIDIFDKYRFLTPKKIVALIDDNYVEETNVENWLNKKNMKLTPFQALRLNEIFDINIFNLQG